MGIVVQGATHECNTHSLDCADLPYTITSWDEQQLSEIAVVDANNDGSTWGLLETLPDKYSMQYRYNRYNAADDYIFLHPVRLTTGIDYEAQLYFHAGSDSYREEFSVGIAPNTDLTKTQTLLPTRHIDSKESTRYNVRFTVDTEGIYHLYVHCTSPANRHMLYLDSLFLDVCGEASIPNGVENMTLTSDHRTPHVVNIACKTPSYCANGAPLAQLDELVIYRNDKPIHTIAHPDTGIVISYNDTVDIIDNYTYAVIVANDKGPGHVVQKDIVAGTAHFPFTHNFMDGIGFFTINDRNADGVTWHLSDERFGGCMRYISSAVEDADDWLFSPPVYLDGSTRYQVEYSCCVGLSRYPESMCVMLGFVPQPQEMSVVVSRLNDFTFINDTVIVAPFDVHVPGIYYMAFRAYSKADSYAILLRSMEIDEYDPNSVLSLHIDNFIRGGNGYIEVDSHAAVDVSIYNLLGEKVGSFIAHRDTRHNIDPGIYIIHAGTVVQKIVVL